MKPDWLQVQATQNPEARGCSEQPHTVGPLMSGPKEKKKRKIQGNLGAKANAPLSVCSANTGGLTQIVQSCFKLWEANRDEWQ